MTIQKKDQLLTNNVLVKLPPLEQRFPMFRQEIANQIMNNVQQQKPAKTEWNFDVSSENDSAKTQDNQTTNTNATTTPNPIVSNSDISTPIVSTDSQQDAISASSSNTSSTSIDADSKSQDNNEKEEVHYKGRFKFKVKKQTSPSLTTDKLEKLNSNEDNAVPQISSSPLFDSPKPLLNSSSSIAPQENPNNDFSEEEEARLQQMVNELTIKVDRLTEEGKEIKQDIAKLLKFLQGKH